MSIQLLNQGQPNERALGYRVQCLDRFFLSWYAHRYSHLAGVQVTVVVAGSIGMCSAFHNWIGRSDITRDVVPTWRCRFMRLSPIVYRLRRPSCATGWSSAGVSASPVLRQVYLSLCALGSRGGAC